MSVKEQFAWDIVSTQYMLAAAAIISISITYPCVVVVKEDLSSWELLGWRPVNLFCCDLNGMNDED